MKVPFVDLKAGVAAHRQAYLDAITDVVDTAWFAGGPKVAAFEEAFAHACGAADAVAVATGTDALILALRAAGVGPGDEVITAPNSFFATAEAITVVGATPVFADVRDDTLLLDPDATRAAVTSKTRAIVPVHLFGQVADMDAFEAIARDADVVLLEDACQAHGATRGGKTAGSIGVAAGFSFYPAKNLGAFGEGGAITTSDEAVAAACRRLRDHGQDGKHNHVEVGYNARLAAIQAACLSVRLGHLGEATEARRAHAARYRERLASVDGVRLVAEADDSQPVYHLLVARVDAARRDAVMAALGDAGVATAIHYPVPIHLQPAYAGAGWREGSFPIAERAAREMISLPMWPEMTTAQVDYVCDQLASALG